MTNRADRCTQSWRGLIEPKGAVDEVKKVEEAFQAAQRAVREAEAAEKSIQDRFDKNEEAVKAIEEEIDQIQLDIHGTF